MAVQNKRSCIYIRLGIGLGQLGAAEFLQAAGKIDGCPSEGSVGGYACVVEANAGGVRCRGMGCVNVYDIKFSVTFN